MPICQAGVVSRNIQKQVEIQKQLANDLQKQLHVLISCFTVGIVKEGSNVLFFKWDNNISVSLNWNFFLKFCDS